MADQLLDTIMKVLVNDALASAIGEFSGAYAQYWNDGPVGLVGRVTSPIMARTQHLMGRTEKLTRPEFDEEVGRALFSGDLHPIPQIQQLAQNLRARVLDLIAREAEELGVFTTAERPEHMTSYFHRIYDTEKIIRHFGDGSADDLRPVPQRAFVERRSLAGDRLASAAEADELVAS